MHKLAVFSTGDDKLVRSILDCDNKKVKIKVIVTNLPCSSLAETAEDYDIDLKCFDQRRYESRIAHEKDIIRFLKKEKIDRIIFAHYMRLVTKYFVDRYKDKIINVHPSLLPDFKGANGYKDAFDAGVSESGCTIHYVDEGLDTGEIILQKAVRRLDNDSFDTFKDKIHAIECTAIQAVVEGM